MFSRLARQCTREEFRMYGPAGKFHAPNVFAAPPAAETTPDRSWDEIKRDIFEIQNQVAEWLMEIKSDWHTEPLLQKLDSFQLLVGRKLCQVARLSMSTADTIPNLAAGARLRIEATTEFDQLKANFGGMIQSCVRHDLSLMIIDSGEEPALKRPRAQEPNPESKNEYAVMPGVGSDGTLNYDDELLETEPDVTQTNTMPTDHTENNFVFDPNFFTQT